MMTNAQKESLRRAALEVLALRLGAALNASGIRRRIDQGQLVDFRYQDEELMAALVFLQGLRFVESRPDNLGSTLYWTATSEGALAHERGSLS